MGKVTMFHPQSGVTQEASEDAYQRVWSLDGWQLVEPQAKRKRPPAKNAKDSGADSNSGDGKPTEGT